MNIKELSNKVDNFIPPSDFAEFFTLWKTEQSRMGFNWSVKSEEIFRTTMLTGMVFLKSLDGKSQEAPQKEKVESAPKPSTGRTRARTEEPEKRTRNTESNVATIETSNRVRTRTRTSN